MTDPYLITGPALISFSGGRTSAYMLHEILRAHGGTLPDDVVVAFANTGKEREETLRFVHECDSRWGVQIHWIEYRRGRPGWEEVGFNSASRAGEPFSSLIKGKSALPNWQARWCTSGLKVIPKFALMRGLLGLEPGQYLEVIGLRFDEGMRILKGMARAEEHGHCVRYPLSVAKVTKADVLHFWLGENIDPRDLRSPLPQGFDLGLRSHEGNCDLCFMKGRGLRKRVIRDDPAAAAWWAEQERLTGGFFDRRDRVSQLVDEVRRSPSFFDPDDDDTDFDAECGLHCGADESQPVSGNTQTDPNSPTKSMPLFEGGDPG